MPDTHAIPDTADPLEDARRWFNRAARCERDGMTYRHCMDMADAALERAGMIVVGEIGHLVKGGE